ncbi:GNAT family N-acetyltransferase [Hungatella sp.]|uniref:GNAT family N-acetyltransferase n=1 Tax=Hungatella sp. TaxID=2613924 RepID=UPI002A81A114|nr:GNAT family N-acetyltransferase [Hungatella sp.]
MKKVAFYEKADDELLQFAVIAAKYQGRWVLCKHKERSTWEFPGGHREAGETIEAAAVRELYEETGAAEYRMVPVSVYSVTDQAQSGEKQEESLGMLFYAEISRFDQLPPAFEMEKIECFEKPPDNWTYPELQPLLFQHLRQAAGKTMICAEKTESLLYRRAGSHDKELLTRLRLEVLRAANGLEEDVDLSRTELESRRYYETCFPEDSHAAWLVFDGEEVVGTGAVSFYQVMPTYHNPSGKKAYIMNMYTRPDYRRRGIAYRVLELLTAEAEMRQIDVVTLEATAAGRPLYEAFGFTAMRDEMELLGGNKF